MISTALDLGVNFIDTANCYDGPNRTEIVHGYAEMMLGEALKDGLRDEFVLLTKAGVPLRPGEQYRGLSSTHLIRALDSSLHRLRTDYVDIFMIHWPDAFADKEEVLRAIDTVVRSGRARYFGISNHQAWEVCEYLWEADRHNFPKAGVSEIPMSLLNRSFENDLPFYARNNIGVVAYQPLQAGLLSGKYKRGFGMDLPAGDRIAGWTPEASDGLYDQLEALEPFAAEAGLTLAEYAFAWVLAQPSVVSAIAGVRQKEELISAVKAAGCRLPEEHLDKINTICPGPTKAKPRFDRYLG